MTATNWRSAGSETKGDGRRRKKGERGGDEPLGSDEEKRSAVYVSKRAKQKQREKCVRREMNG